MDAYAHTDWRALRFRPICGRTENGQPALNGTAGRREDDVEAVTLGLDLGATEFGHRRAHERPISLEEGRGRLIPVRLDIAGVVAQIGEKKAVGP